LSLLKDKGDWKIKYHSKIVGIHSALLKNGTVILFSYPSREHKNDHDHDDDDDGHAHSIFGSASHHGVYEIIDTDNWKGEPPKKNQKECFLRRPLLFI
jgi:hypothetical protein